jgi:hypothetical protein
MPDRYVSDTSSKCMTLTQSRWVTTWVDSCYNLSDLIWKQDTSGGAIAVGTTGNGMEIDAPRVNSSVSFALDVEPAVEQLLTFEIASLTAGTGSMIAVEESIGGQWKTLNSVPLDKTGLITLSFVPLGNGVKVSVTGPTKVILNRICRKKPIQYQESYLTQVCNGDKDRYRFGFNGQEKVNEIAGVGNHNTAEFWEYDTRIARRWNLDPVVKPWESSYAAFNNSPIFKNDVKGDNAKVKVNSVDAIIDISTTVYIRGGTEEEREALVKNASSEIDYMRNSGNFKGRVYEDENGKKWTINIDVKYVNSGDKYNAGDLPDGDNIFDLSKLHDKDREGNYYRSVVYGGDKLVDGIYDYNTAGSFARIHGGNSNVNSGYTALHETMHFLGLVDRYDEKTQKVLDIKYTKDIMGGIGGREVHQNHINNWGKAILKSGNSEFVLKHRVDQFGDEYEKIIMPEGQKSKSGTKPR